MSDITIRVPREQAAQLVKVFKDLGAYTKQLTIDLVKEEGALTCREAINMSPPLDGKQGGKGDKEVAKKWGEWAVTNDVLTVVTEDSKSLAVAIAANKGNRAKFDAWRMGKPPKSAGIVSKIWADQNGNRAYSKALSLFKNWGKARLNFINNEATLEARHNHYRKLYSGRINKNNGKDTQGKLKGQPFTFAPYNLIKDYIKKRQMRVGWMKAGWVAAINKIGKPVINGIETTRGLRKMPGWVLRHNATHGKVGLNISQGSSSNDVLMTVKNDLGNIFGVGYLAGTKMYVMSARQGKMQRKLKHFMRIALDKANAGQSPK